MFMGSTEKQILSSKCPVCGRHDFNSNKQCICGYHADESNVIDSFIMESEGTEYEELEGATLKNHVKSNDNKPSEELVIKEIDSWVCSFSKVDNCICLGTPALQSFKLKLTLNDLEELLEFMYQKTGKERTTRKLQLSVKEIPDLIDKVNKMIEEKKSKIAVKFARDELQEMVDLINMKLKA
jgi:hypothetical protein